MTKHYGYISEMDRSEAQALIDRLDASPGKDAPTQAAIDLLRTMAEHRLVCIQIEQARAVAA